MYTVPTSHVELRAYSRPPPPFKTNFVLKVVSDVGIVAFGPLKSFFCHVDVCMNKSVPFQRRGPILGNSWYCAYFCISII